MFRNFSAFVLLILFSLAVVTQVADAWVHKHLQETQQALSETESLSLKEHGSDIEIAHISAILLDWAPLAVGCDDRRWHLLDHQVVIDDFPIYLKNETLRL